MPDEAYRPLFQSLSHINYIMMKVRNLIVATVAAASVVSLPCIADDGEGAIVSMGVYSYIQGTVPLSFHRNHVVYENIGNVAPVGDPFHYYCRVLHPTTNGIHGPLIIRDRIQINEYAFYPKEMTVGSFQQSGVTSVDIQAGQIRTIPQSAFMFCDELEWVRLHGDCGHFIEQAAFRGCLKMKSIEVSAQLRYVGDYAFAQCMSLQSFVFPKYVEYIGVEAFKGCKSLSKVEFATGHFRVIPDGCFYDCQALTALVIPEGVSAVGDSAFEWAGLREITLPHTMKSIGNRAFCQTPLVSIVLHADVPPAVAANAFDANILQNLTLRVPASSEQNYRAHPVWGRCGNIVAL